MHARDHQRIQPVRPTRRASLIGALTLLAAACGGGGGGSGGGGGAGGSLGAFTSGYQVVAVDAQDAEVAVEAMGVGGYTMVGAIARDSARDLVYAIDADTGALLRVGAKGQVTQLATLTKAPISMAHDPLTDELVGIVNAPNFATSTELIRIDPATGATTVVATTSKVTAVALDRAWNRLLAVGRTSSNTPSNDLLAIDLVDGSSQVLLSNSVIGTLEGITFDPVTRTLHGFDRTQTSSLLTIELGGGLVTDAVFFDRPMDDVVLDHDSGRLFGLSDGGQLVSLDTSSQTGQAQTVATLGRRLVGLTFDPSDRRFFAFDAANGELVKVNPATGAAKSVTRLSLNPYNGFPRQLHTLAYDPVPRRLFGIEETDGRLLEIDPETGDCAELGLTVSTFIKLAIDQGSGRLYGFDSAADVVLEIDPDAAATFLVDNNTGLTKVEDICYEPVTQSLVALHETPGFGGVPMISHRPLSSTSTAPINLVQMPRGASAFGLDTTTGQYYAFGPGHPRYEFDFLLSGSSVNTSARSHGAPWRTPFRAALAVPSHGVVYAIDADGLYAWNTKQRSMERIGNLPQGFSSADLLYDPAADRLGLRSGSTVHWINAAFPWNTVGSDPVGWSSGMRLACDGRTGRIWGVKDGALHTSAVGSTATGKLTASPVPNFMLDAVAYSAAHDAIFAAGRKSGAQGLAVVRFDVTTGDWSDVGSVNDDLRAMFVR